MIEALPNAVPALDSYEPGALCTAAKEERDRACLNHLSGLTLAICAHRTFGPPPRSHWLGSYVRAMFWIMSILHLYQLVISRELTLAIRLTPMMDGYTVRVQVASYQGPAPRFEKHFPPDTPVSDALDRMARYPLDFFEAERGRANRPT